MKKKLRIFLWAWTWTCVGAFTACSESEEINEPGLSPMVDVATPTRTLPSNDKVGADWTLVFSDEFNDGKIDFNKWTVNHSTTSRTPRPLLGIKEWYWKQDQVLESDDHLVLKVRKVGSDVMYCSSVYSYKKYAFKYGYIEARMKIADIKKATHTAFWLQNTNVNAVDGTGNDGAEVDIFESAYVADKAASTIHIDGYGKDHQQNHIEYESVNLHDDYHIWGLLWDENSLKVYYDGVLKAEFDGKWIPKVEEYIQLSTGATFSNEGNFIDQPSDSWLSEAYVDYVRVWKLGSR